MWLKKKASELRVVIILLLIILMVCITGIILYKNLSAIARNVSSSINVNNKNSQNIRQILIEIREAENNVKAYNLTHNKAYLISFYSSAVIIDDKINEIYQETNIKPRESIIIDSIVLLNKRKFELLRNQLYADDETKITDELNTISKKIDEAYEKRNYETITQPISKKDSSIKKEHFLKRLFNKQHSELINDEKINSSKTELKQFSDTKNELKKIVKKVQNKQLEKLTDKKNLELKTENEGKFIVDKIRAFLTELEESEKNATNEKIAIANKDVNVIKTLAIIISVIISLLLLIASFLIVNYVEKKKEYEIALIQAKQNAEDLAKTKETFLANMSHEIRTPLNAIYGFTEQVLKSDLNPEQYEQLNIVKKSAFHLINLISDILDYSKIQAGKLKIENIEFNLEKELNDIHLLFAQQCINKQLELIFTVNPNVPNFINSDLTKLKQIMYNLIGNAIKFTEKGTITVIVKNIKAHNSQHLHIQIIDTGIGIPKEKIPKLFNEYEQAHSNVNKQYGGTGLGLVITKKLLEKMGGCIFLKSEEQKGTRITIKIPYYICQNSKKNSNTPTVSSHHIEEVLVNKRILIVDDEEFNRLLLKTILLKFDATITEAENGDEAISLIQKNNYDIVLMDIRMPKKNGIEACTEIRKFNKQLVILAATAAINQAKTEKCIEVGFNGFVYKPFTEQKLLENIYHFLKHQTLQQNKINTSEIKNSANMSVDILNFNELRSISNGNKKFEKDMIMIFYKSINSGLKKIEVYCQNKKWKEVSEIAHKIMPSCKHFEANNLCVRLNYFESLKETTPIIEELNTNLTQLKQDITNVNKQLQPYL
ncbi:MAG: hypothetical protein C0448_03115 [Sphingobacteriaceae bacterium]|nr:hypothetical protein [Sphingobacteriaceae bacterium]